MPKHGSASITGIGESDFSRHSDKPFAELQARAVLKAIDDAGIEPSDIEGVFTEAQIMPQLFPIDRMGSSIGLTSLAHAGYYSSGGTGIGYALMTAFDSVARGACKAALVYFGVNWGSSTGGPYLFHDRYAAKKHFEQPFGFYGQPLYYALLARRYAADADIDLDDLAAAMGSIATRQRSYASNNSNAQMTGPLAFGEYLDSRMIADPIRLLDCCLLSDGAAAVVISNSELAERATHAGVTLLGGSYGHQTVNDEDFFTQNAEYPAMPAAEQSGSSALQKAGVAASDLDFVQIYDCFTISVLIQLEALGVCRRGQAVSEILNADAPLLERMPVNTHGGFLSQAYLLGINHLTEAIKQLRGSAGASQVADAKIGAVTMSPTRDHTTLILGGVDRT